MANVEWIGPNAEACEVCDDRGYVIDCSREDACPVCATAAEHEFRVYQTLMQQTLCRTGKARSIASEGSTHHGGDDQERRRVRVA